MARRFLLNSEATSREKPVGFPLAYLRRQWHYPQGARMLNWACFPQTEWRIQIPSFPLSRLYLLAVVMKRTRVGSFARLLSGTHYHYPRNYMFRYLPVVCGNCEALVKALMFGGWSAHSSLYFTERAVVIEQLNYGLFPRDAAFTTAQSKCYYARLAIFNLSAFHHNKIPLRLPNLPVAGKASRCTKAIRDLLIIMPPYSR